MVSVGFLPAALGCFLVIIFLVSTEGACIGGLTLDASPVKRYYAEGFNVAVHGKRTPTTIYTEEYVQFAVLRSTLIAGYCNSEIITIESTSPFVEQQRSFSADCQIARTHLARAPVREVWNVTLTSDKTEDYSHPVLVQELDLSAPSSTCDVFPSEKLISLVNNTNPVLKVCINQHIRALNGAMLNASLCSYNDSGYLIFANQSVYVEEDQTKYSLDISNWPWVNRTRDSMLFTLDTQIMNYGLSQFEYGWMTSNKTGTNRNYLVKYATNGGLGFSGVLQFWAVIDGQVKDIYINSKLADGDIDQFDDPALPGRTVNKFAVTIGFKPFDLLEWDPSLDVLFKAVNTPTDPSTPAAPELIGGDNTVVTGASIGVVGGVAIVSALVIGLVVRYRLATQSQSVNKRLQSFSQGTPAPSSPTASTASTPTAGATAEAPRSWARATKPPM